VSDLKIPDLCLPIPVLLDDDGGHIRCHSGGSYFDAVLLDLKNDSDEQARERTEHYKWDDDGDARDDDGFGYCLTDDVEVVVFVEDVGADGAGDVKTKDEDREEEVEADMEKMIRLQ